MPIGEITDLEDHDLEARVAPKPSHDNYSDPNYDEPESSSADADSEAESVECMTIMPAAETDDETMTLAWLMPASVLKPLQSPSWKLQVPDASRAIK